MNENAKNASKIIDSVAKAVANWTADEHIKSDPSLPDRYGSNWRTEWTDHTVTQVQMLSQSVAVRSPALFSHHVLWTHDSFEVRGIKGADLLQNMTCMRDVLVAELPPPVGEATLAVLTPSISALKAPRRESDLGSSSDNGQRDLILKYLESILDADRNTAESLIISALDEELTIAEVYERILSPAQARLGRMWHRGEISVADEHYGSAITQQVMSLLRPHFKRAEPNGRTVVATGTPGNLHEIGLRMVSDLFEIDGWNVIYLGANTPAGDLIEHLERHRPDLLALSISTGLTVRDAGELIERVRGAVAISAIKILVGGQPFLAVEDLWQELGADGCAPSASHAVREGHRLVSD